MVSRSMLFRHMLLASWLGGCLFIFAMCIRSYWLAEGFLRCDRNLSIATVHSIISNRGTVAIHRLTDRDLKDFYPTLTDRWNYYQSVPQYETYRYKLKIRKNEFLFEIPMWIPAAIWSLAYGGIWICLEPNSRVGLLLIGIVALSGPLAVVCHYCGN